MFAFSSFLYVTDNGYSTTKIIIYSTLSTICYFNLWKTEILLFVTSTFFLCRNTVLLIGGKIFIIKSSEIETYHNHRYRGLDKLVRNSGNIGQELQQSFDTCCSSGVRAAIKLVIRCTELYIETNISLLFSADITSLMLFLHYVHILRIKLLPPTSNDKCGIQFYREQF